MLACKNNIKKKYSGKENTPMGYGYASCSEKEGTIMKGKDESLYIVIKTKSGHRWTKIDDLDNLPSKYYRRVYYPEFSQENIEETGLESKIGGNIPFFIFGESWPTDDEDPLTFIGQFIDPSSDNNIMYRFFLKTHVNDENKEFSYKYGDESFKVMPIKLTEEIEKQQNKIDNPNKTYLKPFIIDNWSQKKELVQYELLLDGLKYKPSEKGSELLSEKYSMHKYTPSYNIKFKGTSTFCQYVNDKDLFENFFQISECKELPITFGDGGILQFIADEKNDEYNIHYDCC